MSLPLRIELRRWTALLLLSLAAGLTFGAPLHARHDTGGDPAHQRACVVVAWSKAVQAAALTPQAALALPTVSRALSSAEGPVSSPDPSRPTPQARAPPFV